MLSSTGCLYRVPWQGRYGAWVDHGGCLTKRLPAQARRGFCASTLYTNAPRVQAGAVRNSSSLRRRRHARVQQLAYKPRSGCFEAARCIRGSGLSTCVSETVSIRCYLLIAPGQLVDKKTVIAGGFSPLIFVPATFRRWRRLCGTCSERSNAHVERELHRSPKPRTKGPSKTHTSRPLTPFEARYPPEPPRLVQVGCICEANRLHLLATPLHLNVLGLEGLMDRRDAASSPSFSHYPPPVGCSGPLGSPARPREQRETAS